jgi:hypothetical protein
MGNLSFKAVDSQERMAIGNQQEKKMGVIMVDSMFIK